MTESLGVAEGWMERLENHHEIHGFSMEKGWFSYVFLPNRLVFGLLWAWQTWSVPIFCVIGPFWIFWWRQHPTLQQWPHPCFPPLKTFIFKISIHKLVSVPIFCAIGPFRIFWWRHDRTHPLGVWRWSGLVYTHCLSSPIICVLSPIHCLDPSIVCLLFEYSPP